MMNRENNPAVIDPMALWCSFQDANLEVWAKGMASLVNTESYARAMSSFLDNYLATSAPFRKIFDQYMGFCLSSLNMPSRDEIIQLEQRLITSDVRLSGLYSQLEQVLQSLHKHSSYVMSLDVEHNAAIDQLESHIQVLEHNSETMSRTLHDRVLQITELINNQQQGIAQLGVHLRELGSRIDSDQKTGTVQLNTHI